MTRDQVPDTTEWGASRVVRGASRVVRAHALDPFDTSPGAVVSSARSVRSTHCTLEIRALKKNLEVHNAWCVAGGAAAACAVTRRVSAQALAPRPPRPRPCRAPCRRSKRGATRRRAWALAPRLAHPRPSLLPRSCWRRHSCLGTGTHAARRDSRGGARRAQGTRWSCRVRRRSLRLARDQRAPASAQQGVAPSARLVFPGRRARGGARMRSRLFGVGVLVRRARALVGHAVCAAAAVAVAITELSDDQRERPSHGL